jgi:hypothetical protein
MVPTKIRGITTHRLRGAAESTHIRPYWRGIKIAKMTTITRIPVIPERPPP